MRAIFKSSVTALAISLSTVTAQAAPVTHQLSMEFDASGVTGREVDFGNGLNARFSGVYSLTRQTGFPFAFSEGDTIEIELSFINGGLKLNDKGFGLDETIIIQPLPFASPFSSSIHNPGNEMVLSYDRTTTVTVNEYVGDLANSVISNPIRRAHVLTPAISPFMQGNFTDSSITISRLTVSSTFTNVMYFPGFENFSSFRSITAPDFGYVLTFDELSPASVPLPGALALIGVGLFGVFSLRRKKTTKHDGDQS